MGWAEYHRAAPAGLDLASAVARARKVVASCAVGVVRTETTLESAECAALDRLAACIGGVGQQVDLLLLPADAVGLTAAAWRAGTAVTVQGQSRAPGVQVDLRVGPAHAALLLTGASADAKRLALRHAVGLGVLSDVQVSGLPAELPASVQLPARLSEGWSGLWCDGPTALRFQSTGGDALLRAAALWNAAGDTALAELWIQLDGEAAVDALVGLSWPSPVAVAWWCGFDDHGPAFHGVRLGLHGRYQDGRVVAPAADHDLVLLVSGKRPDADALVARLQERSGIRWVRDGSGL